MSPFLSLVRRDLRLAARGGGAALSLSFFAAAAMLFPVALGHDPAALQKAAAGILWAAALLAALLSLESLFHRDHDDGTFDLLLLGGVAPLRLALAKMLAHWLAAGLPLACGAALAGPMLGLPAAALPALLASLLAGTLYMSLLGGTAALLTCGARRPGMLTVLRAGPWWVPLLFLGGAGAGAGLAGLPQRPYLLLQLALLLAAGPLLLAAGAKILQLNQRSL